MKKLRTWLDEDVTEAELTRLFGRSPGNIAAWVRHNDLARNSDGTFNLRNSIFWLEAHYRRVATVKITMVNLTQGQLSELLGVTRQTVFVWEKKKGLPRNSDGSYDLMVVLRWLPKFYDRVYREKYEEKSESKK